MSIKPSSNTTFKTLETQERHVQMTYMTEEAVLFMDATTGDEFEVNKSMLPMRLLTLLETGIETSKKYCLLLKWCVFCFLFFL